MKKILLLAVAVAAVVASQAREIKIPKTLHPGSKIAIVTPASAIKSSVIDTAIVRIREKGYEPVVFPHAYGSNYGSFPATDEQRADDLMMAFLDPEIDAILCSRGGYGTVRLLPMLDTKVIRDNPKWLIGYSDISDLHALMHKAGVASIHGPMAGHLASEPDSVPATQYLWQVLEKGLPLEYNLPPNPYNRTGSATGRLLGGNLLTINGLSETPYDVMNVADDKHDVILFIEDIGEKIYAIERVLMRMHLDGSLSRLKGLIVGQFNGYSADEDFKTMEDMIYTWLKDWGYYEPESTMPIVFDFPTGHVTDNYPMICNANAYLKVTPSGTTLTFTPY